MLAYFQDSYTARQPTSCCAKFNSKDSSTTVRVKAPPGVDISYIPPCQMDIHPGGGY